MKSASTQASNNSQVWSPTWSSITQGIVYRMKMRKKQSSLMFLLWSERILWFLPNGAIKSWILISDKSLHNTSRLLIMTMSTWLIKQMNFSISVNVMFKSLKLSMTLKVPMLRKKDPLMNKKSILNYNWITIYKNWTFSLKLYKNPLEENSVNNTTNKELTS